MFAPTLSPVVENPPAAVNQAGNQNRESVIDTFNVIQPSTWPLWKIVCVCVLLGLNVLDFLMVLDAFSSVNPHFFCSAGRKQVSFPQLRSLVLTMFLRLPPQRKSNRGIRRTVSLPAESSWFFPQSGTVWAWIQYCVLDRLNVCWKSQNWHLIWCYLPILQSCRILKDTPLILVSLLGDVCSDFISSGGKPTCCSKSGGKSESWVSHRYIQRDSTVHMTVVEDCVCVCFAGLERLGLFDGARRFQ